MLHFLYNEVSPTLKQYITNNNGGISDAEDIIQDAIIVFYEKVKQKKIELHSNVIGYIYITGKNMWHNRLRKDKKIIHSNDEELSKIGLEAFEIDFFDVDEIHFVNELLKELSSSCQTVLTQSIYEKKAMTEIAEINGYKSEQIARNKKYKCLKQLKNIIESSNYYKTIISHLNYE